MNNGKDVEDEAHAATDVEPQENVPQMGADGAGAHRQVPGNLLVSEIAENQFDDLRFSRRKAQVFHHRMPFLTIDLENVRWCRIDMSVPSHAVPL